MIRFVALFIAAAVGGCATAPERTDPICTEIAAFASSLPVGEKRTVRLETAWGSGLNGREDVLFEKQCEHADYDPAKPLCRYLIEHTSTEFMAINVSRVLSCFSGAPPFREVAEVSVHQLSGTISASGFRGAGNDVEVTLVFSTGCRNCDPFLELAAEKLEAEE